LKLAALFGAPSPRENLRDAHRELAKARAALTKAQADSARVRELTTVAGQSEIASKSAQAAVRDATSQWTLQGAPGGEPPELQRLMRAADQLTDAAKRARHLSDAARKTLNDAGAIPAEQRAVEACREAEFAVKCAATDVLLSEISPALNRAIAARAALDAELPDILAIYMTLRNLNVSARFSSGAPAALLENLERLLKPPKEATILANFFSGKIQDTIPEQQSWIAFGDRLVDDADAGL
jgi:hypothetical protein